MNTYIASGNLGADGELRFTAAGNPVLNFSIAVNVGYGDRKSTYWVSCAIFGKRAEALQPHLIKGQQVIVTGELNHRKWERDGQSGTTLDLNIDRLEFVGSKPETQHAQPRAPQTGGQAPAQQPAGQQASAGDFNDDIPF